MKKIMLLSGHDIDVLQNSSVSKDVFDVYKKGLVYKLAKKSKYTLPFSFAEWTTLLHLYDIVVIFDTYYNEGMVEYIYKISFTLCKPNFIMFFSTLQVFFIKFNNFSCKSIFLFSLSHFFAKSAII